jgi:predicted ATPase/class 3 adenylate cyclase
MDPEEFLDLMNEAFDAILAPVFQHGGYVARLEGDGFKAFFGAPEAHEDDPLRAVRAGLGIQSAARALTERFQQTGSAGEFAVRVGIHTDYVVVGPVGSGNVVEYTAMGIGIVLAARLENIAQPGTVLISETTYRLIEPYVEAVPWGPTTVKGRTRPVHLFEVVAIQSDAVLDYGHSVRSHLVGRDVERTMLRNAVSRLLAAFRSDVKRSDSIHPVESVTPRSADSDDLSPVRHAHRCGCIIQVVGEAGVGKSRLIGHIRNHVTDEHPELIWLNGRALAQGQGAYGVLADLVRNYIGIGVDDRMPEMWSKLRHRVARIFPASSEEAELPTQELEGEAGELVPHLANLISLHLGGVSAQRVNELDPEAQERQMFRALRRLCERLADSAPVVLSLDDLHAADEGAIRLLQDLIALVEERPILFIFAFRPEPGAPCWRLGDVARRAFGDDFVEIPLHTLAAPAANELIDNLLENPSGEGLSESIRALIRERSGGNPLFIEEVVRSLVDRGVLARSGPRWQVVRDIPVDYIPDTLHGVILARLDRLDVQTRRILQVAAVIGRSFSLRVLRAVLNNGLDLQEPMAHLQRAELLSELRRAGEQVYSFNHALTQQVAYDTLLRRQRREYHRRVATCVERLYADRLEEQYERLAHHYASAESWAQALDYHIRFASHAQLRFANAKAKEHYQRAWEIVEAGRAGDATTRCTLHEAQGNLELLAGDYVQAGAHYEAALELSSEPRHQARLLRKLGNVCQGSGEYAEGIAFLEQGLTAVSDVNGPEAAALYAGLGQLYHRQTEYDRAIELGLRSLALFEQLKDRQGMALASNLLGISYWAMGDLETARAYHEKGLLIHASLGDVPGLAASYNNLGRVLADEEQLEAALRNFRQSQQLCTEIGYQHGLATALSHLSEVYQQLGQTEEALRCQERAFEIYNLIGFDGLNIQPEVLKMQVW